MRTLLVGLAVLLAPAAAHAQDPNYSVSLSSVSAVPEQPVVMDLFISSAANDLAGMSLGICHDPSLLNVVDIGFGADLQALNGGDGPDFFSFSFFPDGLSCGTVFNFFGDEWLPVGPEHHAVVMTYETFPTPPVTTELQFCDGLGSPPVTTVLVDTLGASHVPTQSSGFVEFIDGPVFIRGDTNNTGNINLADPIVLLTWLFQDGTAVCESAMDVNGDETPNLVDALHLLLYINGLGPAPTAPFPDCGVGDPGSAITCTGYTACP